MKIVDASNYVGLTRGHFYLLPSSMLDAHRLRSCIRYIVRVIKSIFFSHFGKFTEIAQISQISKIHKI